MLRIALATSSTLPRLFEDDHLLVAALERLGCAVTPSVWDDPAIDFQRFDAVVIRSTWDYTDRRDAFVGWAERVARVSRLFNPASIVRWNSHKGYLKELEARGIAIVPTEIVRAGTPLDLPALAARRGWDELVVKPCISAGARDTVRVGPSSGAAAVEQVRARGDVMVQPYQPAVEAEGEHALVFFDGELSHALRKPPQLVVSPPAIAGTPRASRETKAAQEESQLVERAPDDMIAAARRVLAAVEPLLYARVDLVRSQSGQPQLMELEVIEPRLFFPADPPSADRFARAICARLR